MAGKDKVWILTREHNEYDQFGQYFVAVFKNKPSWEVVKKLMGKQVWIHEGTEFQIMEKGHYASNGVEFYLEEEKFSD